MNSLVVSASDPGIHSVLKCLGQEDKRPQQVCDILIQMNDLKMSIDLPNLKLKMLGNHQLRNALTAICAVFCLRDQGWTISDMSVRAGLERTQLLGRSQILTHAEAEAVGLSGASILIDGAHTESSAEGLAGIIKTMNPDGRAALIVAMASDKDHKSFAKQILSGSRPEIVLLTEVSIAGGRSRSASASALKDSWIKAAADLQIDILDVGMVESDTDLIDRVRSLQGSTANKSSMLIGCHIGAVRDSLKIVDQLLTSRSREKSDLIVVTGSLHIVASVLAAAYQ